MTPVTPSRPAGESHKPGHRLLAILQLLVTAGLMFWLLHDPHRRTSMWSALQTADWRWLIASITSAGLCEFFGILRWQIFLKMLRLHVGLLEVTKLFFIGAFFNQFLPGTTGGDVVRVIYLMKDHPEHRTAGFMSVAIDRLLAMLVLVAMGLAFAWSRSAWFAGSLPVGNAMKIFAWAMLVIGAGLAASFLITSSHLTARLPHKFPMRERIVRLSNLWQLCLENRREAFLGTIFTVPMLLAYFATFYFAALAFTAKVSFLDMTSIMPLVTTLSSLPISLNGMGVREALFENMLFDLCGVPQGTGLLISITGMFVYLLWGLPGGFFYLGRIRQRHGKSVE